MFLNTYDFKDAATQLRHARRQIHHSRKDLILHFLEVRGGTAAASLALEGTLTVPLSAWKLPLPRYYKCVRKERRVIDLEISCFFICLVKTKRCHTHSLIKSLCYLSTTYPPNQHAFSPFSPYELVLRIIVEQQFGLPAAICRLLIVFSALTFSHSRPRTNTMHAIALISQHNEMSADKI